MNCWQWHRSAIFGDFLKLWSLKIITFYHENKLVKICLSILIANPISGHTKFFCLSARAYWGMGLLGYESKIQKKKKTFSRTYICKN